MLQRRDGRCTLARDERTIQPSISCISFLRRLISHPPKDSGLRETRSHASFKTMISVMA